MSALPRPDVEQSAPVDLLTLFVAQARPLIADKDLSTKARLRNVWSAVCAARDLASSDVVADQFMRLAVETNLIDERGRWTGDDVREDVIRHGREDVRHCIEWALRNMYPFEGRRS